ncbi:hypothetical protein IHE45_09G035800 [Dioscorea alata]|uniref:Uncharacterized protein n=1 Tax=Dioscorea alata TaxID=55571 RepID=A0ACB7VEG1_DIOAL|nr:hypothetical protein IHE45_09G035800 [Dioscorea alata]
MDRHQDVGTTSGRGQSGRRSGGRSKSGHGGRSTSGRGHSTPNIRQRSGDNSTSIRNTVTDLGMPPCIHPNIQPTTTMTPLPPITQPSPAIPLAQSPPVPHGETSAHASDDYSSAMEVPSNESNSIGPPWLITPDSLIVDYEVKRAIHELVKGHYKEPWTGWGKVPKDVRQRIFTAFRVSII